MPEVCLLILFAFCENVTVRFRKNMKHRGVKGRNALERSAVESLYSDKMNASQVSVSAKSMMSNTACAATHYVFARYNNCNVKRHKHSLLTFADIFQTKIPEQVLRQRQS